MISLAKEHRLASLISWGALAVTLVITDRVSTEPANVGKMVVLSALGFGVIPLIIWTSPNTFLKNRFLNSMQLLFLISLIISIFASKNTLDLGFYGIFGRNTGFLSYLALSLVFLGATQLRSLDSFEKIRKAFFITGAINILYCLAASTGHDIFTWQNPSDSVLGTFGNSNFIGAFMGMYSGLIASFLIQNLKDRRKVAFYVLMLIATIYVIYLSKALQGMLLTVISLIIVLYFYLRSRIKSKYFSSTYLTFFFVTAVLGLAGILNFGPFSSFLHKSSVTFRGEYWIAGIKMGIEHPFFGVGLDSFGFYYRSFRNESATKFPGVDVTSDAAHNVLIDIFSSSGLLASITYLTIVGIILWFSIRHIRTFRNFDPIFSGLFVSWVSYQLQSFISINQLGLAIWGWVLGGALVAYCVLGFEMQGEPVQSKVLANPTKKKKTGPNWNELPAGTALLQFICIVAGLMIALPPFVADAKFRSIVASKGDEKSLTKLAEGFPTDATRINRSLVLLANSGLTNSAIELAKFGISKYPNDFASWYSLYELSELGSSEKEKYRVKLHQIDPFNPKYSGS